MYDEVKINNNLPEQIEQKIELLSIIFLHQFTHILGFNKTLLLENNIIKENVYKSRLNNSESIHKYAVISESVLKLSRTYFNCSNLTSLELDSEISLRDFEDLHWESRLLLGDYMTGDIYYLDQVISEFTLALLDSFDFYEINYYTGGLMNFGKNKGCSFINEDCIKIISRDIILSSFPNEFCSYYEEDSNEATGYSFGSCSSGRQSMGYCYNSESSSTVTSNKRKDRINYGLGLSFIEDCPISYDTDRAKGHVITSQYYNGNCKFGKGQFGR